MNENNLEFQKAYSRIIKTSWVIIGIVTIIITILGFIFKPDVWYSWTISYLLGTMVNLLMFNLLKNNISSLTSEVKAGITSSFSNYVIRLAFYGFILYIAFNNNTLNPYIVASGFLTVRVAIYIYSFNKNKEE